MSRTTFQALKRWRYPAASLFTLLLLVACGGDNAAGLGVPAVASVEVGPAQHALLVSDTHAYTARALDASGNEVPGRAVTWSSTDETVATVTANGIVTAMAPGTAHLRAIVDGKIGSGILTVSLAPVASVAIDPAAPALVEGEVADLTVVAKDAAGRVLQGRPATWSSSNTAIATISATGEVTALSVGTSTISASVEGVSANSVLTVTAATVDRVEFSNAALTIAEGASTQLAVSVKDALGRVLDGRVVQWSTNDPQRATVDATGRLTAVQAGAVTITANVEGKVATLPVTITPAPVASVQVTPAAMVLEIGESRAMTAVAKDAAGRILTGRTITWSATAGVATISPNGVLTALRGGYLTITATTEGVTASVGATAVQAEEYDYDLVYHRTQNTGASELYTVPIGLGTAPSRLNAGAVSRNAAPSPDGLRVAFAVSQVDLTTQLRIDDIFAVDVSGMNMKQLTNAVGYEDQPTWSPSGDRIAYHHYEMGGPSDIWVMLPDGRGQVNLTGDMPLAGFRSSPAWSPDGTRIAFAQSESGEAGTEASIWTMRADGTDKRRLTSTFTGFDASPTWSADGTRIAFVRYYNGDADITLVDTNGGATQRIALVGRQSAPAWSPDGAFIAFSQDLGTVTNLFTMRPDGSQVRLRTTDTAWGGGQDPAWIRRR